MGVPLALGVGDPGADLAAVLAVLVLRERVAAAAVALAGLGRCRRSANGHEVQRLVAGRVVAGGGDGVVVAQDAPTALVYGGSLTITEDGLYLCTANIGSTSQPAGGTRRYVRIVANGSTEVALRQGRSTLNGTLHSAVTDLVRLEEGDELDTIVYQDSGYTMSYYGRLTALLVAP